MDTATTRLVPQSNAGECQSCKAKRQKRKLANSTHIYAKRGGVRYCVCNLCGSTWKKVWKQ